MAFFAGLGEAPSCAAIGETEDRYEQGGLDNGPSQASSLPVGSVQPHYLGRVDEDWVRFDVPE